jgi:hypothetical protein
MMAERNAVGPVVGPARSAPAARAWLGVVLLLAACSSGGADRTGREDEAVAADIEAVLERRTPELMRIEGVQGVGQALCDGAPCIRVYVVDAGAQARVPARLDGFPVSTVITGVIRTTTTD